MSLRFVRILLGLQLLALFIGTQMPGAWRASLEQSVQSPLGLSSLAHFVVFASMAALQAGRPLLWPRWRVVLGALFLALLTEGLQFFAIDRHPRWLDVGIDLAGTVAGLGLVQLLLLFSTCQSNLARHDE